MDKKMTNFFVSWKKINKNKKVIIPIIVVLAFSIYYANDKNVQEIFRFACEILNTIFIGMGVFYGASYVNSQLEKVLKDNELIVSKQKEMDKQFENMHQISVTDLVQAKIDYDYTKMNYANLAEHFTIHAKQTNSNFEIINTNLKRIKSNFEIINNNYIKLDQFFASKSTIKI